MAPPAARPLAPSTPPVLFPWTTRRSTRATPPEAGGCVMCSAPTARWSRTTIQPMSASTTSSSTVETRPQRKAAPCVGANRMAVACVSRERAAWSQRSTVRPARIRASASPGPAATPRTSARTPQRWRRPASRMRTVLPGTAAMMAITPSRACATCRSARSARAPRTAIAASERTRFMMAGACAARATPPIRLLAPPPSTRAEKGPVTGSAARRCDGGDYCFETCRVGSDFIYNCLAAGDICHEEAFPLLCY
jgi:hypothetical protein